MTPRPGDRLGRFEVERQLGRGTFAAVYLARDILLDQRRALKIPHDQTPAGREALLGESRLLASLDHPHIVRLLECDEEQGQLFVVMEWVDGQPLSARIEAETRLHPALAIRIATQVVSALVHAHGREVLHGDLSSDNILLRKDDAKLSDFGMARTMQLAEHDVVQLGNPFYLAPEQFRGEAVFASDLYSAGVVLFEMLTGEIPYRDADPLRQRELVESGANRDPRTRNPLVSAPFAEIVERALAPRIPDRYGDAEALLSDLRQVASFGLSGEDMEAVRARIREGRPSRRRTCWNCGRPRHPDAAACAHCGA